MKEENETTQKRKDDKWGYFCVRERRTLSEEEYSNRTTSGNTERDVTAGGKYENSPSRTEASDSDHFRFWPAFTSEEEKSKWWTEATAEFRNWREAQPEVYGVYDGPTSRIHEKFRRNSVKQTGNGIVASIAKLIAKRIIYHEEAKLKSSRL